MADRTNETTAAAPGAVQPGGMAYASPIGRRVIAATVLGSGLAQLDATVVNVALPAIGLNLHAGLTSLQWTLNAYTLTLSGLLLLGGSLGDRLGRRRIYLVGVVWFTLASVGCALAPTAAALIAMRALQGVGSALLTPGSLAILQAVFRPADRAPAVGAWSGLGGIASAIGPVLGGLFIDIGHWGWRLIFVINVPLAAVVIYLSRRFVPESRDLGVSGRIDVLGTALAGLGLAGLVYGLTEGPADGWTATAWSATVVGVALLTAFVLVQRRIAHPLVPPKLFADRQFTAANLVTLAVYAALSGGLFLLPVQLQVVSGFSAKEAGVALLPLTIVMFLLSARAGRLASRFGPRWFMAGGPVVAGAGIASMATIGAGSGYWFGVLPPVLLFALGLSATVAPLTATVLAAAPNHWVGIASAVNNDVARVAGLLAVAVLPGLAGLTPTAYQHPAELSVGFSHAVLIAGALCVFGGLLAAATIRNPPRAPSPEETGVLG